MPFEFHFDADQDYQIEAVNSVCDLFDGQGRIEADIVRPGGGWIAIPNRLELTDEQLLRNLQQVQGRQGLLVDGDLQTLSGSFTNADSEETEVAFCNFSVEMETGTGKTYVYIRTALEMLRRYGFRKFIIVVPSIAIREGVLKTFEVTRKHFAALYGNTPYHFCQYDSANLSQVRQFALSESLEFMVMTLAAFNKATNVIRQSTDRLQGETPIHLLQATRPVLILDEPQNMESELSIASLALLHPLLALRYSATHRNAYNLVHKLTPYDAYRLGLVKRIEVAGATASDANQPYLRLESVKSQKQTVTAKLRLRRMQKDGTVKEASVTVRPTDDLAEKANLPQYEGLVVDEIDVLGKTIYFANGTPLAVGQDTGADKEALFREQIAYTVEQHVRKQRRLAPRGIKVISLFFIDRVDNYAGDDSLIRRLFDEAFLAQRQDLEAWKDRSPEDVQAAYFAQRRTREGEVILEDSSSGEAQKDQEAYDLIMRDKERLLSFDDPHCFIFSHSALREGWDNPNVCQICSLRTVGSDTERRQQIGRGARLVVDQTGTRVRDDECNVLTVVANESYETYVAQLQQEVEAAFGRPDAAPRPTDARKRVTVHPRKEYQLKPEFRELWERIKHKTRYSVSIDTDKLLGDVVRALDDQTIEPPKVRVSKARIDVGEQGFKAVYVGGDREAEVAPVTHSPLRVLRAMEHVMLQTTPPMRLTRNTLLTIWERTNNRDASLLNPQEFASVAAGIIKRHLADHLVQGIQYEKLDDWYEMTRLDESFEDWAEYLEPAGKSYYEEVKCESGIERDFVRGLEEREDVLLYIKLPWWFTVPTPVGEYNPDWAVVMGDPEGGEETHVYLVRETKSTTNLDDLHPDEARRIRCGRRHFTDALGVDYRVVAKASELP